jgi:hypothetical protein
MVKYVDMAGGPLVQPDFRLNRWFMPGFGGVVIRSQRRRLGTVAAGSGLNDERCPYMIVKSTAPLQLLALPLPFRARTQKR